MINGLDLFSGIGGITKALEGYVTPVAYCERERYAQAVLLSRMAAGDIPVAPIWDDVTTLHGDMLPPVEIIYGGFPCQDRAIDRKPRSKARGQVERIHDAYRFHEGFARAHQPSS